MKICFRFIKRNIFFTNLFFFIMLAGCVPESKVDKSNIDFIYTQIGEQHFKIPKSYLKYPHLVKEIVKDVSFLVMYPDYKPPIEAPAALLKKGEWYKNVSVSFRDINKTTSLQETLDWSIEFYNATKIVGDEHGLIYRTYPEGSKIRRGEMWLEKDGKAYITCSTPSRIMDDGRPTRPQCNHRFIWKKQHVEINIDHRLLPYWQDIKENVIKNLESFEVKGE